MGARILLVEGDPDEARRLTATLRAGAEPFTVIVTDAAGTAAALAGEPFAGVVLDAQTSAGRDLLVRLRADHPRLPIVALVDDEAARADALAAGATEAMPRRGAWHDRLAFVLRAVLGRDALEEANARIARGLLFGREAEMELLRNDVAAAVAGHGRVVLVGGDAGIGKSALAGALSRHAAQAGCRVLWGHCHDGGGAPPYRPWAQALRALLWHGDLDPFLDRLGPGAAELAQLVPAFASRLALPQPAANVDPEAARFRFFDSVALCLRAAAHRQPLLLLFEDLHCADLPSLRLLHFVAQEIVAARVCIVATHRPPEGTPGHQVDAALSALRHAPTHVGLPLRGLSAAAVRALLSAIAGHDVPADFAHAFHVRTEGNPLFVNEIVRHLVEEQVLYFDGQQWTSRFRPEELPIPPGVADVIRRRLAHLSPACRDALAAAAVVGREFDAQLVTELAESPAAADPAVLAEALSRRVVIALADAPHAYRFDHPLIREILYGDLPAPRRVHLHRLVARALETLAPDEQEARIDELAYHFCEAAPDGDLDRALAYACRAGDAAARARAHEVSVRCYEMALRALRLAGASDHPRRAELLVRLGGSLWRIDEFARARRIAMQAVERARRGGDAETLARAALCYAGDLQGFGPPTRNSAPATSAAASSPAAGRGWSTSTRPSPSTTTPRPVRRPTAAPRAVCPTTPSATTAPRWGRSPAAPAPARRGATSPARPTTRATATARGCSPGAAAPPLPARPSSSSASPSICSRTAAPAASLLATTGAIAATPTTGPTASRAPATT